MCAPVFGKSGLSMTSKKFNIKVNLILEIHYGSMVYFYNTKCHGLACRVGNAAPSASIVPTFIPY
jgi:hypothetical protein